MAQIIRKMATNAYFHRARQVYDVTKKPETISMIATLLSGLPALRRLRQKNDKPRIGLYDNPHRERTDMAMAWDQGRNADDFTDNPYPRNSNLWCAWRDGDKIRQRVETTIL